MQATTLAYRSSSRPLLSPRDRDFTLRPTNTKSAPIWRIVHWLPRHRPSTPPRTDICKVLQICCILTTSSVCNAKRKKSAKKKAFSPTILSSPTLRTAIITARSANCENRKVRAFLSRISCSCRKATTKITISVINKQVRLVRCTVANIWCSPPQECWLRVKKKSKSNSSTTATKESTCLCTTSLLHKHITKISP